MIRQGRAGNARPTGSEQRQLGLSSRSSSSREVWSVKCESRGSLLLTFVRVDWPGPNGMARDGTERRGGNKKAMTDEER